MVETYYPGRSTNSVEHIMYQTYIYDNYIYDMLNNISINAIYTSHHFLIMKLKNCGMLVRAIRSV